MMRITSEQEEFLKTIKCERLSKSNCPERLFNQFESRRGKKLVEYLKTKGENEDLTGTIAVYIILNKDNYPLAFFSLKCGLLFTPKQIEDVENDVGVCQNAINILNKEKDEKDPDSVTLYSFLDDLASSKGCTREQMIVVFKQYLSEKLDFSLCFKRGYHKDEKEEKNKSVYRVHESFSAVELVHFCKNDNAQSFWDNQHINHSLGEVIFWKIIVDRLIAIKQIVGCQYFYLFAADASEDETLVNYYNVSLKFKSSDIIGTIKPLYDFCCVFLLQDIDSLVEAQKNYFDNFNLDENAILA